MKIKEIITHGEHPNLDSQLIDQNYWNGAELIQQVYKNVFLYKNSDYYFLAKDKEVIGYIKLSQQSILNQTYEHIDSIYVKTKYRNTHSFKWLIFSVKQLAKYPIIADGAIFKGGNKLIQYIINNNIFTVSLLNKVTGVKIPATTAYITHWDLCYLFEQNKLDFDKQYRPGGRAAPNVCFDCFEPIK